MNASDLIDDLIAKLTDWRGVTFTNIRKIIRDADPEIVEEWKWMGAPVWSNDGIVCVANAFKDKVKLTFYDGASLPDPDKLFNNGLEGKKWRTIDFYKDDKVNESSLAILVHSAVNHNHAKVKTKIKAHGTRSVSTTLNRDHAAMAMTGLYACLGGRPRRLGATQAGRGIW